MIDTIFRQYDIRGKVDSELIIDEVYNLGCAIATYFLIKRPGCKIVALGRDGRNHSPIIENELKRALQDSGFDVLVIGMCPTPVMYFTLHTMPVDGGLMVTASHNTKEYNGIKICLGKESVWGDQIQEIKNIYSKKTFIKKGAPGSERPYAIIPNYVNWLKHHFQDLIGYNLSVIFDCAHGSAGAVMSQLLALLQWPNAQLLYERVDGEFPAHEADPVVEKNMQDLKHMVLKTGAQLGIGFDGDCDRMAPLTDQGALVLGDKLLAVFSHDVLKDHSRARIVFDIKCSFGLTEVIEKNGGIPCLSATGHSIIKNRMKQEGALLGGELSCHFFFADRYFGYDDGIYAALRLIELMKKTGASLHELITIFPQKFSTPELRIECPQDKLYLIVQAIKDAFQGQRDTQILTIDGVRVQKPYGWGLVRASHTQPVICLRFEADIQKDLRQIQDDFFHILQPFFDDQQLKRHFYG